jgi:acyl-[acyl-carrier-protein]-phospholipid O-acyltransferase/long-chain-fatty-acid--[acyl-carrier-protein] ligase
LVVTQFFGAANDNILKGILVYMVIDGAWAGQLGSGGQGIVSVCFTLPFIVLSGYAGQFADRNSKRYVSVLVKVVEVPIALLALFGFLTGNLWITLIALVLLTCQSAYFGPAKYGMIPELVGSGDLSRANGVINMMTNLAVIAGTLAAGTIADLYSPRPDADGQAAVGLLWLPGLALLAVALAGLMAVVFLPRMEPGDRTLTYNWNPVATYVSTLKEIFRKPLLMVMLAWGYFYFLAGLALLILPEYTVVLERYGVSRAEVSLLLGVMGVAIGVGSAAAGLISGHAIRPRLVPIGAVGLTFFFCLLGTVPPSLPDLGPMWRMVASPISGFIFGAGVFAGFYIIPLQALLQKLSPDDERGRFLGTANGVSFAFLTLASLIYWIIRPAFGTTAGAQHPEKIFLVSAVLMIVGAAFFLWRIRARGLSFEKVT